MDHEKLVEILQSVRNNPRAMHISYLEKLGVMDAINELVSVPETWKLKEKIDVILSGTYNKCYCGNLAKPKSRWCGSWCKDHDPEIRAKIGFKNHQNKDTRVAKAERTRLERYGVKAVQDIPAVKIKMREVKQIYYDKVTAETFNRYGVNKVLLSDHEHLKNICVDSSLFEVQREHFGMMPVMTIMRHFSRIGFDPGFKKGGSSNGERELYNWLDAVIPHQVLSNHRKTLGKELDVYLPEKKLGIEYHGLYWHLEQMLADKNHDPKKYHLEKLILANDHGINLLQFFEDEWLFKQSIVKSMILSKLGIYQHRHYARDLKIAQVSSKQARIFLVENHLQGAVNGTHVGLWKDAELVSMVTVGKSRFTDGYELLRFATKLDTQVVGGFSRLLKHAKKDIAVAKLTTYADRRYSTGDLYRVHGEQIRVTDPGYFWVEPGGYQRINRFQTQKHKLPKLLGATFDPKLSEAQNMEAAGYYKIYDCGQLVFTI